MTVMNSTMTPTSAQSWMDPGLTEERLEPCGDIISPCRCEQPPTEMGGPFGCENFAADVASSMMPESSGT